MTELTVLRPPAEAEAARLVDAFGSARGTTEQRDITRKAEADLRAAADMITADADELDRRAK